MYRERLPSLLAALREREQEAHRLSVREAKRIRTGPPAMALRLVIAHTNETLDELAEMARQRQIDLGSVAAVALDTIRRVRDALTHQVVDGATACDRALSVLHEGLELARRLEPVAVTEGDDALVRWCRRWLCARERLFLDLTKELASLSQGPLLSSPKASSA